MVLLSSPKARALACLVGIVGVAVSSSGCRDSKTPSVSEAAPLPESYWMATPPADAASVHDARARAADAEPIAVVGRVSGIVDGRAQFRLTDLSFTPCNQRPGDSCATPWDYCCEAPGDLAAGTVVVELREDGALARRTLRGFHGFDLLKEVVVEGTPAKDAAGNVTLVATGLHVREG